MSDPVQPISPPPPSPVGAIPPAPRGNPFTNLLVGLVLLIVIGGGLAIWIFSHSGGAARSTAEQFVRDLSAGDVAAARAKCLDSVLTADLERHSKDMQSWGTVSSMTMVARDLPAGPATPAGATSVAGDIDFANLRKSFTATLIKQGDAYRIQEYAFR